MNTLLDFQIIREDLTPTIPPTVEKIGTFRFTPGEKRTLAIQLLNSYNGKPYVLPSGWQAVLELPTLDPLVPLTKTATVNDPDRSILLIPLSAVETTDLISGKIKITISEIADPTNLMIVTKNGLFGKAPNTCIC